MTDTSDDHELLRTPLHALHAELGGRLVPFAGYEMPVQYEGVVAEHLHTRASAGLFDVSHMGVVEFHGDADVVGERLEYVLPSAIATLKEGRQRYSFLLNDRGGVIDDLMVTRTERGFGAILNAGRKHVDIAHLREHIGDQVDIVYRDDVAILALQGPSAVSVIAQVGDDAGAVADLAFMDVSTVQIGGVTCNVSRSGYTGEDGVELVVPGASAVDVARKRLAGDRVAPIGLGARDTLRLEAGLCLYGNDLTEDITPVEADLVWAMQKRRRTEGGFIGADVILGQLEEGPARRRVGIRATGRRPVRDHADLRAVDGDEPIGIVTSGGFGPTVDGPVAMGYVPVDGTEVGTPYIADVRGKDVPVEVAPLPFAPHRYHR